MNNVCSVITVVVEAPAACGGSVPVVVGVAVGTHLLAANRAQVLHKYNRHRDYMEENVHKRRNRDCPTHERAGTDTPERQNTPERRKDSRPLIRYPGLLWVYAF